MSVVPIIVLALAVLLAVAAALHKRGSQLIAPILGALAASPICYFLVGVLVPRVTGEGHFFSVPFGGLRVGDIDILLSVLAWSLAWWVLFHYIAVVRRRG
jgi:hypothetical protein